jgi:outer membrane protein
MKHGDTLSKFEAPVVGSVNVFNGFGDVANLHSIEAIIAQRHELLLDLQSTVLLNVAQAFYAVLRSEQQVDVLQRSLATEEARLADVEARLEHGLATKLAVAQTRAQVDQTRVLLLIAQSDVKNGRTTLARVVGLPSIAQPLADTLRWPDRRGGAGASRGAPRGGATSPRRAPPSRRRATASTPR